jgi:hypothetical protein
VSPTVSPSDIVISISNNIPNCGTYRLFYHCISHLAPNRLTNNLSSLPPPHPQLMLPQLLPLLPPPLLPLHLPPWPRPPHQQPLLLPPHPLLMLPQLLLPLLPLVPPHTLQPLRHPPPLPLLHQLC